MTIGKLPGRKPRGSVARARRLGFLCLATGLMVVSLTGCADETEHEVSEHAGHPLGAVNFPVTCIEQAQVEFNRAVALLHHMTYPQAREAV